MSDKSATLRGGNTSKAVHYPAGVRMLLKIVLAQVHLFRKGKRHSFA